MASLSQPEWAHLFRLARRARLFARLSMALRRQPWCAGLPQRVRDTLESGCRVGEHFNRAVRWEANRVCRALVAVDTPVVLLKGAAYVLAELPTAEGRVVSDIDILVSRQRLAEVESALLAAGWESLNEDEYDDNYYRKWMHELPPLVHRDRRTVIDVHHTILPQTGRVRPDAESLLASSRPLGDSGLCVLAPENMVLHAGAHLFQDGDLAAAYRDLVDLDTLLRHFAGEDREFWARLIVRARKHQLARALYYTLRYAQRLLGTPVPQQIQLEVARFAPRWHVRRMMDWLVPSAFLRFERDDVRDDGGLAHGLLYIRAHWLRMPPWLLTKHLTRKALRSWTRSGDAAA